MKQKLIIAIIGLVMGGPMVLAQSPNELLEERTRQLHQVFQSSDQIEWQNYIQSNYSKTFLNKYEMSRHVGMFERLHKDFSNSQIHSIKINESTVILVVQRNNDSRNISFEISFSEEDAYKFNGISIEAGELRD